MNKSSFSNTTHGEHIWICGEFWTYFLFSNCLESFINLFCVIEAINECLWNSSSFVLLVWKFQPCIAIMKKQKHIPKFRKVHYQTHGLENYHPYHFTCPIGISFNNLLFDACCVHHVSTHEYHLKHGFC